MLEGIQGAEIAGSTPYPADATAAHRTGSTCVSCHGSGGIKGLDLSNYESTMAGGESGEVVLPGDSENSLIVEVLSGEVPHFAQFNTKEMNFMISWIDSGALEK